MKLHASNCVIGECNIVLVLFNFEHRHAKRARVIFLVIGSRSIRRTVHSNDLVKFLGGLRCSARRKLEIYNL